VGDHRSDLRFGRAVDQALVGARATPVAATGQGFVAPDGKIWGVPMPSYKFKIGDVVTLKPAISRNVPGGTYQVTKRLPENRGEFEYYIKNLDEPYARIVRESELTKA
jgi:hypothetical protein